MCGRRPADKGILVVMQVVGEPIMWQVHPSSSIAKPGFAGTSATSVFPRYSTRLFKETLAVIGLALVIMAVVMLVISPASGKTYVTGSMLKGQCERGDLPGDMFCAAYITGAYDQLVNEAEARGTTLCVPDTVSANQLDSVVMKYLKEHPEKLRENAAFLVLGAIADAFPCN